MAAATAAKRTSKSFIGFHKSLKSQTPEKRCLGLGPFRVQGLGSECPGTGSCKVRVYTKAFSAAGDIWDLRDSFQFRSLGVGEVKSLGLRVMYQAPEGFGM